MKRLINCLKYKLHIKHRVRRYVIQPIENEVSKEFWQTIEPILLTVYIYMVFELMLKYINSEEEQSANNTRSPNS